MAEDKKKESKESKKETEEQVISPDNEEDDDDDEGGGAPEWMATFADLVTLLMCFFVLLFAMSSTQQESFKELVQSLQSALGVQQVPEAGTREGLTMQNIPEDDKEEDEKAKKEISAIDELGGMVQKELDNITSEIRELIMFNKLGGMVNVQQNETGAVITISDVVLFPAGKADMSNKGSDIMKQVSKILNQFPYHIKIAGHTDNAPIHTKVYPSNWELSTARACEVVRYLISKGLNPKLISAEGYAEFAPIATNDTKSGKRQNRRVEIVYERKNIISSLNSNTN